MSLCSICRSLLRALPRSQHHAGDNQQDPRHTDPCDGLMQHKHGNDRAGQPQNSASHADQTQNGQHNDEYLCSCDGGCRQEER